VGLGPGGLYASTREYLVARIGHLLSGAWPMYHSAGQHSLASPFLRVRDNGVHSAKDTHPCYMRPPPTDLLGTGKSELSRSGQRYSVQVEHLPWLSLLLLVLFPLPGPSPALHSSRSIVLHPRRWP
jgi:hypothetical protein